MDGATPTERRKKLEASASASALPPTLIDHSRVREKEREKTIELAGLMNYRHSRDRARFRLRIPCHICLRQFSLIRTGRRQRQFVDDVDSFAGRY